jgi:hypothetical protein
VEDIIDSNGVKIWEKIVDYIPINSEWSNILPNTDRYFKQIWRWFPYYALDENGDRIIEYRTPSEYYAMQYKNIFDVLYPWQRIYNILNQKKIKAITNISYTNYYWEEVSFNSEKDFYVEYEVEVIWYDPFFFIVLWIILIILWFFLILWKRVKKKKCPECGKWIEKKLKVCPYCWINLKTLEILSEKETTNTKRKIPKKQVKSISKTKKTTSKKS